LSTAERAILVIEDDSMVRGWVRLALEDSEFRVAGEASDAEEALRLARKRGPDVLLVDYRLGGATGTEVVRTLRLQGVTAPAVLMTASPQRGLNEEAREVGAQGSVLKTGRLDELLATLRAVAGGQQSFDVRHPRREPGRAALSPRERQVLTLVARGATNREIAAELEVHDETVKTLLARTYTKLGVRRRSEAVSVAHGKGLL
jgi:DNA-binding NarL/FixJ family response regulator